MDGPTLFDQDNQPPANVLTLPVRQAPVARTTDPETSKDAAASLSRDKIRETQANILEVLERYGPSCDEEIAIYFQQLASLQDWPRQSPSGLRSRRAELVSAGLVKDSGERTKTASGRQTIVWELSAGHR